MGVACGSYIELCEKCNYVYDRIFKGENFHFNLKDKDPFARKNYGQTVEVNEE